MLMLPFTKGVVTTLLLFSGWLRTDSGTVIRAGSFPCDDEITGMFEDLECGTKCMSERLERLFFEKK